LRPPTASSTSRRARWDFERHHLGALLESAQLDRDLIAAGHQVDDLIRACFGGRLMRFDVRRQVRDRDRRAGDDTAARVADHAAERGAIDLRQGVRRVQQEHGE